MATTPLVAPTDAAPPVATPAPPTATPTPNYDLVKPITMARQANVPDDETLDYIGQFHPELQPKIQQARQGGVSSSDILNFLSKQQLAEEKPAPEAAANEPDGSPIERYFKGLVVNPAESAKHYLWDQPSEDQQEFQDQLKNGDYHGAIATAFKVGAKSALGPLGGFLTDAGKAQIAQARQAWQSGKQGDYSEAFGHGLAAAIPLIGPAAAEAGEKIGSGNVAEGLGEATGLLLSPVDRLAGSPVTGAIGRIAGPLVGKLSNRGATPTVEEAAASTRGQLESEFQATPYGKIADLAQAATNGDTKAANVLNTIRSTGTDPDKALQASIQLKNYQTSKSAGDLYDQAQQLAGNSDVPLNLTTKAVKDSIFQGTSAVSPPSGGVLNYLRQVRDNLPYDQSYGAVRKLSDDLGAQVRSYYQGKNALIGSDSDVALLQRVKSAVDQDVSNFANSGKVPGLQQAQQAADNYYRSVRVPFKDSMVANAAVTTEPDQIFGKFVQTGKGDRATKFYQALDPRGQSAVRYGIVADAMNQATDAGGEFDVAKFGKALDKSQEAQDVFMQPGSTAKFQMDGLRKMVQQIMKSGPSQQAALKGLALVAPPAAAKVALIASFMKPLMMTTAGQRYLLAASSLAPGTVAMANLMADMTRTLPSLAAAAKQSGSGQPTESGIAVQPANPQPQ